MNLEGGPRQKSDQYRSDTPIMADCKKYGFAKGRGQTAYQRKKKGDKFPPNLGKDTLEGCICKRGGSKLEKADEWGRSTPLRLKGNGDREGRMRQNDYHWEGLIKAIRCLGIGESIRRTTSTSHYVLA